MGSSFFSPSVRVPNGVGAGKEKVNYSTEVLEYLKALVCEISGLNSESPVYAVRYEAAREILPSVRLQYSTAASLLRKSISSTIWNQPVGINFLCEGALDYLGTSQSFPSGVICTSLWGWSHGAPPKPVKTGELWNILQPFALHV